MRNIISELEVEKEDLTKKIYKLQDFTNTEAFRSLTLITKDLLIAQLGAMRTYKHILTARITTIKGQ